MQVMLFSVFMSLVWGAVLAAFNYFCRKKQFLIRQLGMVDLLFLYLFSIVRFLFPDHFSFARVIPLNKVLPEVESRPLGGAARLPFLPVLAAVWGAVAAVLLFRFIWQYGKAMREFSASSICEDAQCGRIFRQVLMESQKQMDIKIRRSRHINIPMGVGIFRKSIILPNEHYNDDQLRYILLHEYTHFQNRDLLVKTLIHIYGCIFWWNPAIYRIKRDLAQVLEIRCDLDVTEPMEKHDKAEYLATIVAILKNASGKRQAEAFYGATALIPGDVAIQSGRIGQKKRIRGYDLEVLERFQMVSGIYGKGKGGILFAGGWIMAFILVIVASYSVVIQPDGAAAVEEADGAGGEAYSIKCVDGKYYIYFP